MILAVNMCRSRFFKHIYFMQNSTNFSSFDGRSSVKSERGRVEDNSVCSTAEFPSSHMYEISGLYRKSTPSRWTCFHGRSTFMTVTSGFHITADDKTSSILQNGNINSCLIFTTVFFWPHIILIKYSLATTI